MMIEGIAFLQGQVAQGGVSAKAVLNERGAAFFSSQLQHREQKANGISYEDNYKGNALAAMIYTGRIEIRFHKDFPDARVGRIVTSLLSDPHLEFMRSWEVTYQGRRLK